MAEGEVGTLAAERVGQPNGLAVSSSYVFESPLIEQGTVLLDTAQDTSTFALHQQYFHKSVMLLLEQGIYNVVVVDKSLASG